MASTRPARSLVRHKAVVLLLLPMKDKDGRHQRHPVPFRARSTSGVTDDALCFYPLFTRYWWKRVVHPRMVMILGDYYDRKRGLSHIHR